MARPQKRTVEYFPHFVKSGRTIYILEAKYGNDGYAFWFKLLELLCDTEGQVYNCNDPVDWEFLVAKTKVEEQQAKQILDTLASLGTIDKELWQERRIVWVENLLNNLYPVYSKRNVQIPEKPVFGTETTEEEELSERKPQDNEVIDNGNPQSKVKYSKVKESKDDIVKTLPFQYQKIVDLWNKVIQTPKVAKLTDDRRDKIKARLKDWKVKTQEEAESQAWEIFNRIKASDFLSGRNDRWKATFDWTFANDKNYLKILEGNYDNRANNAKSAPLTNDSLLGVGEYLTEDGRRTYGTGKANIPMDAPARPSDRYAWDAGSKNWIIQ